MKPYKFTDIKKEEYLKALRGGNTRGDAANMAGVTRWTVRQHRDKDKKFDDKCENAETDAVETIEDALYEAASYGNITAQIFFLKNRRPDKWRDRQTHEVSGPDGGPIEVDATEKLAARVDDIAKRRAKAGSA
jgi:hypothetical protein